MSAPPSAAHHRTTSSSLGTLKQLEVVLLPEGQVAPNGTEPDPTATWELLGHTWEAGTTMGFVRVEMAGASWAALIPQERLGRIETGVRVQLRRQSSVPQDPLLGWTLFC